VEGGAVKSLHAAMLDPDLFGRTFGGESFGAWRAVAKMLEGAPLDEGELALWREISGRAEPPTAPFDEAYIVKPRRAGGTLFAAAVALHAAIQDYSSLLGPGEVATVALIAQDRRGARQAMNFCKGLIADSSLIGAEVVNKTAESITFAHRVVLEIHVASFRSTRGYSYATVILDELAFYRSDFSANPDTELVRAVRPGLANLHGRLLGLSSPHSRRGHLFDMWQQHYGKASDVLVISAGHRVLNPTIDERIVQKAMQEDPEAARAEWFGQFRGDVSQFLPDEAIDIAIAGTRRERAEPRGFAAFVDMSGGLHDASVLAIAHLDGAPYAPSTVVLDRLQVVAGRHEPQAAVEQFCGILRDFSLTKVTGDRYAGDWVAGAFRRAGIRYEVSELDKSAIYAEVMPLFAERRVELLRDQRLITELRLLERRPRSGGKGDAIDHPPRSHDDAANAVCGALWLASSKPLSAHQGELRKFKYADNDVEVW
jgi:hypothetical protein